jgi:hypothetical protein
LIAVSTACQAVLTRSHRKRFSVASWYNGQLLADDIPASTVDEETDRSLRVPERVVLRVPRRDRSFNWAPGSTVDHPLAANGQRLYIKQGIGLTGDTFEWFQRGVYLIEDTAPDGDTVNVTAVGLLALIEEARLVSPLQPTGTMTSALRSLIEPALTVSVSSLVDRAVPSGINFDEDRLGAVMELLDAWSADGAVDPYGVLQVVPAGQSLTPVLTITDGVGGTINEIDGRSTRDDSYNAAVARGTAADGGQLQAIAYDNTGGPTSYGGPFSPLPVPYFFASPLLTTQEQVNAAAQTVLARLLRTSGRLFTVRMVPNPTLQCGDTVTIVGKTYAGLASIESMKLPIHPDGDFATLTVRAMS